MENFAATDRTYSDGQKNREEVPDEIVKYGFKPPVKLPDGSIEVGDFLSANHLNYIFNDLYSVVYSYSDTISKIDLMESKINDVEASQQSLTLSFDELTTQSLRITEKGGNNNSGYLKYSNGDIEMWGEVILIGSDQGTRRVDFPVVIPAITNDIILTDFSSGNDVASLKFNTPTVNGFNFKCDIVSISGTTVTIARAISRVARWRAKYHG